MNDWQARRFWTRSTVMPDQSGRFRIALDDRVLQTPGKHELLLPTAALARAVATEWDAQSDLIRPDTMPLTRAANSAIEKVAPQHAAVASMLAEYGATDLLCYRADGPARLVDAQARGWDPLIDWARHHLAAPLRVTTGVIPVPQDPGALARLADATADLDAFGLTALHDLVTLPGSLLLGLAVIHGRLDADEAFALSRIDEDFQRDQWGTDADAEAAAESRRSAMISAQQFWNLSRPG